MNLVRWDPMREMLALRNTIDRFFDEALARPGSEWFASLRESPPLNLYATDTAVVVEVPLPGMQPEEVEITMSGNTLTIKGEQRKEEEKKGEHYYRREVHYGAFARSVALPDEADVGRGEATFDKGVLKVTFPKVAAAQPKRLEIKTK